ncbi:MAG: polysaccharide deacetylase family protein [Candidatus Aminicenantes bacterium]|nr:polysaccharide deacetylase family protein [Candidatus Aminicenantes bacterium]
MRIRGIGRLKRLRRWMTAPFRSEVIILLYHRVFDALSDPQLLCVKPKHFTEHLEHIRRHYRVMSLGELGDALKEGQLPKRAIIITFDDGYVDNLLNAKPLLERYEIPATVFVATGYFGRMFWWDELEQLVFQASSLPERLKVTVNGKTHEWYLDKEEIMSEAPWNMEFPDSLTPRYQVYRDLHRLLRPLIREKREDVLSQLRAQVDVKEKNRQMESRAMKPEEIRRLAEGRLIEIGSHSETHPVLSALPIEEQRNEIRESKRRLEEILGSPVAAFSYPYGGNADIGQHAVGLVQEAGYLLACANFPVFVTCWVNPFLLPRCLIRDWDGDEFAKRLRGWFYG